MELTAENKQMFIETAKSLHGSDRRLFMAWVVGLLGSGGQRRAASELGWDRDTIRKGQHELSSGFRCQDNFFGARASTSRRMVAASTGGYQSHRGLAKSNRSPFQNDMVIPSPKCDPSQTTIDYSKRVSCGRVTLCRNDPP